MKNLDLIAEELFNKIRGRFPSITIGDKEGKVTNEPKAARFYDFDYKEGDKNLGKISLSLTDEAVEVMYSNNFVANEDTLTRNNWFNFLKELRNFAKKRLLKFDTRNINKSNLDKRDYKFLAKNRIGDETMTESKMYGTSKTSYQNVGEARIAIKHTQPVNMESATGRIQHIGAIYIESADGERFMYPYKHLNGARAMARHVSEGGKPYDDFGKHITGLSEELSSLKKFKSYVNRSSVMAEGLSGYVDVVNERVEEIKKTIFDLQKESRYKEVYDSFEVPVFEEVPNDVAENWIDQLTIRQFNEELKDVFPYVYRLVSEVTKAKTLSAADLLPESEDTVPRQHAPYYVDIRNGKPHIKVDATNTVVIEPSSKWTEITPDIEQRALRQGFSRTEVQFNGKMYDVLMSGTRAFAAPSTVQQMVNAASPESKIESAFEEAMGQFGNNGSVLEDLGSFKSAGIPDEYSKNLLRTINIDNDVQIDKIDGLPKAKDFNSGIVINVLPNGDVVSMLKTKSRMERGDVYFRIAYTNGEFERELKPNVKSATQGMNKRGEFYLIDKRWWDYTTRGEKPSTDPDDVKSRTTADPLGGSDEDIYSYMNDTFMPKMKQQMESMIDDIYANLRKLDKDKTRYGTRLDNVQRNQREEALQAATAIEKIADEGFTRSTMEEFLRLGGKLHRGWGSIPNNERELRNLLKDDSLSRAKWAKTILNTAKKYHQSVKDMLAQSTESEGSVKDDQLPLSEFILSMYDRETGQFPKGETAVLTAVEKDYGESYIQPAKQFIEAVNAKFEEVNGYKDTELDENPIGGLQQQLQNKGIDPNNPMAALKKGYSGIFSKLEQDLMPQIQAALKSGNPQDQQLAKKWMDLFKTAKNQTLTKESMQKIQEALSTADVQKLMTAIQDVLTNFSKEQSTASTPTTNTKKSADPKTNKSAQSKIVRGKSYPDEASALADINFMKNGHTLVIDGRAAVVKDVVGGSKGFYDPTTDLPFGDDSSSTKQNTASYSSGDVDPPPPEYVTDFPSKEVADKNVDYFQPGEKVKIDGVPHIRDLQNGKKVWRPETRESAEVNRLKSLAGLG